jgi:CheY-like chemotaxis protein
MENVAVLPPSGSPESESRVRVLVADADPALRSLLAARAARAVVVLEAADGAEAIQLGLQHRPQIALLDVDMPLLGGIEAAITLGELQPWMRIALHAADPDVHCDAARAHRLPLFDRLELGRILDWLEVQAQSCTDVQRRLELPGRRSLECCACGYGICSATTPERCPMCQARGRWRPLRREVEPAL